MIATRTLARIGGLLYLIVAVTGGFSELYARGSLTVAGDGAATAANIAQHSVLFRIGFVADIVAFACFLAVGLVMYALLRHVNPAIATAMLMLNAVSVAISALNMLSQLGALLVVTDPHFTAGWTAQASNSLVLFLMEMHHQGYLIAQVFFGLYLLPLGYLVYQSAMFPRALGAVLMAGCGGYLAGVVATYASPALQSNLAPSLGMIGGLAEIAFLLWLLVIGPRSESTARSPRLVRPEAA